MAANRMFAQSSKESCRYQLILKINLLESKNQFNLYLKVGYGFPTSENNELFWISYRKLELEEGKLKSLAFDFNGINEIIADKFKGEKYPVQQLYLQLTSEIDNPIIYEKTEITAAEALKDYETIKSKIMLIGEQFAPSKRECRIL